MSNFKEDSILELALCILNDTVHPLLQITSAVFREFSFNPICTNLVGNFNFAPILILGLLWQHGKFKEPFKLKAWT